MTSWPSPSRMRATHSLSVEDSSSTRAWARAWNTAFRRSVCVGTRASQISPVDEISQIWQCIFPTSTPIQFMAGSSRRHAARGIILPRGGPVASYHLGNRSRDFHKRPPPFSFLEDKDRKTKHPRLRADEESDDTHATYRVA